VIGHAVEERPASGVVDPLKEGVVVVDQAADQDRGALIDALDGWIRELQEAGVLPRVGSGKPASPLVVRFVPELEGFDSARLDASGEFPGEVGVVLETFGAVIDPGGVARGVVLVLLRIRRSPERVARSAATPGSLGLAPRRRMRVKRARHLDHYDSRMEDYAASVVPDERLAFLLATVLLPLREVNGRSPVAEQRVEEVASAVAQRRPVHLHDGREPVERVGRIRVDLGRLMVLDEGRGKSLERLARVVPHCGELVV
jgi:hypothetical protein